MSSIDHVQGQETAEGLAEQIAIDGSAGSDTDTRGPLKSDTASKDESDAPHHARSNSVKKPTTFKAVSVTKNFLAKAGTPTAPAAKTNGDNGASHPTGGTTKADKTQLQTQQSLGPRCHQHPDPGSSPRPPVAPRPQYLSLRTSGPGMEDLVRTQCKYGIETEVYCSLIIYDALPTDDCSAAPQPTPKHFTDEELKQQYGIHLATRLQADADGKESKWADIDDDEDDWAPETIEWNDGTKIDLSQNNPAAILAEEQARAMIEKERQEEERKSKLAAQQKPTTTVGPNATILKPRSATQPKSGGVVLKATSEKPTLVAKPSAPALVRSPWASLPPVAKVPPIDIDPPGHPTPARPHPNESQGNNSMAPPPLLPAMEIAADDFTRTRRDNQNGNLGQLYNAQSGQYEPANAGRRGSVRKDQSFRPPSLLQRGSQYDQQGPAEPSAAFQTHRSGSQQDHPLWTRRGSSTVSGDSGPLGRRTSINKGSDVPRIPHELHQRRESQPLVSPLTPGSKHEHQPQSALQSPAMHQSQPIQEARSATGSPYQGRNGVIDVAQPVQRDEVAAQRALMKEKRELAIKRKKEEEEREEAAKKERIRIRMEKLGMTPLEEKSEKREPEQKQIEKRAPEPVKVDEKEPEKSEAPQDVPQAPVQVQDSSSSVLWSPPKPPVPDASGTPQKYGLMRVHANPLNNVPHPTSEDLIVEKTRSQPPSQKASPPGLVPRAEAVEPSPLPMVNGVTAAQKHPDAPIYRASDNQNQNMAREPRQQPWSNSSRDQNVYGGWNGQNVTREQTVSNSVWGPTSHSRTLGNGTFGGGIQRPQSRPQDQFASPALAPIGPPRNMQRPRKALEVRPNDINPVVENFQTIPTYPPSDAPAPPSTRPEVTGGPISDERQISPPQFDASSQRRPQINGEQSLRDPSQQKATLAAWGNFKNTDAEKNRQLEQQHAARLAEDLRNGIQRPEPQLPVMNETWRQVKIDEQSSQRQIVGVSRAQNHHDRPIGPQINGDIRPQFMGSSVTPPITAAGMGRGSRFFPSAGTGLHPQYQGAARFPLHHRSSSPPPPDDEDHPAYSRDPRRSLVKLPGMKDPMDDKTPKVRLPPTIITPVQSPQMSEVRAMPFRAASQPLVNNPSWQDRFNGLLGVKKTSPERKFAHVADGFSATKVPLDSPLVQSSASVSLPPQSVEPISRTLEPASKRVEDEEELFENREFGSLPAVSIPTKAPEIGWMEAKAQKRSQSKQPKTNIQVEPASRDTLAEHQTVQNGSLLIFINLVGMELPKSIPVPGSSAQTTKSGISPQRNGSGNSKLNKSYKSRESSGNFGQTPKNGPAPPRNTPQSGPHSQPQGQPKNHPTWGPRTANAVH